MPSPSSLKPHKVESRQAVGLASWIVNIPRELSATGKRQRLFFRTEKEAKGECEKLKARKDNFGTALKSLTAHEIHETVRCHELLEPYPTVSLLQAVQGYIEVISRRTASVPLATAIDEYLNLPRNRSFKYLRDVGALRETFQPLSEKLVVEITPGELDKILARFAPSTRNAHLRILKAIFNLAIRRGWLIENPIARLDFAQFQNSEVEIFTVEEVKRLLQTALECDLGILPHLVFAFFAGIRPDGELSKLQWSHVSIDGKEVVIPPQVAKGGKRRRFVTLSDNAIAWLEAYRQAGGTLEGPVTPYARSLLTKNRRKLQALAGVSRWIQTGPRHSYCSYWLGKFEDANKLVLQTGHTNALTMWEHYHAGATKAEAERFWSIIPSGAPTNVVAFERSA